MMTQVSQNIGVRGEIPNSERSETGKRGCGYYFKKFDDTILRPIFIYKYSIVKHKPEADFNKLLLENDNRNSEIG